MAEKLTKEKIEEIIAKNYEKIIEGKSTCNQESERNGHREVRS